MEMVAKLGKQDRQHFSSLSESPVCDLNERETRGGWGIEIFTLRVVVG